MTSTADWETVNRWKTYSPSHYDSWCPKSNGRPHDRSLPSQSVWPSGGPEQFHSPPPLSCTPAHVWQVKWIIKAESTCLYYRSISQYIVSLPMYSCQHTPLILTKPEHKTIPNFPAPEQTQNSLTCSDSQTRRTNTTHTQHRLISVFTFISPSSTTNCQLASPPTSCRE